MKLVSFGGLCILCLAYVQNTNAFFNPELLNGLTEVESAQILHRVPHGSRKRSVSGTTAPGTIHTTIQSEDHGVTLTFKQSERLWSSPLLSSNSRKTFHRPCVSSYEDVVNNAHAMVDTCDDTNNLKMLAEVLIDGEIYIILPNKAVSDDSPLKHGLFRIPSVPYNLTNDYIEPVNTYKPELPDSHRVKRADPTPHLIELVFVIDQSLYQFWYGLTSGTLSERETTTNGYIQTFYSFLANGMKARYNSLTTYGLNIDLALVAIYVVKTQGEMTITGNADFTNSQRGILVGETLLDEFKTWVADQKANNQNFPQNADHFMLLTGHDITLDGQLAAAGYAFLGQICTAQAVSLVDLRFDFIAGTVATHELGHSLGARHDGLLDGCNDADKYILSTTNTGVTEESKKMNPWLFSQCSADAFKTMIAELDTAGTNCLLTNDAQTTLQLPSLTDAGPGITFDPDRQCEIIVGTGSEMKRSLHQGKYADMCTGMWCTTNGATSVTLVIPVDGTKCGNKKWCMNGVCVASTAAPEGDESCLYGDQPGDFSINQRCSTMVTETTRSNCYITDIAASCCASCPTVKLSDTVGCEYGDKEDCSQLKAHNCYDATTRDVQCCQTCKDFEIATLPADCKYGDSYSNCVAPTHCAEYPAKCCQACYNGPPVTQPATTQGSNNNNNNGGGGTTQNNNQQTTQPQVTTNNNNNNNNNIITTQASSRRDIPGWIIPTISTVGGIVFVGMLIALITYLCNERKNKGRPSRQGRSNSDRMYDDYEEYYEPKDRFTFGRFSRY